MKPTYCIQNGTVVLPGSSVPGGTVVIDAGLITYAGKHKKTPRGAAEIDAAGGRVCPGLTDVHVHGAGLVGWETCSREGFEEVARRLLRAGIVRFLPTMMADESVIERTAAFIATSPAADRIPGLYVEGPFVSNDKRGGIQPTFIRPVDLRYLEKLQRIAGGTIRMMTFAPELDGAEKLPAAMRRLGILPCLGHTAAPAARAAAVCCRGTYNCTHLYNAMSGLDHRAPGTAAFALNSDRVYTELNPDGTHVAPALLKLTLRAKRPDRIVLVSDAVVSAGTRPGVYRYMNMAVRSTKEGVYYREDGTLVGSSILLNEGLWRFIRQTGAPLHAAVAAAAQNPAAMLGRGRRTGSLEPGKDADIAVFSRNFSKTAAVFLRGERVV